ncbi:hypothetical protein PWT90_02441 [Aphanocladium album]|nr:hypothetical protein PWT90_02441 [Aphanocladium album]
MHADCWARMEAHIQQVKAIQERVRHFYELKLPFRIYHGSTNSIRYCSRNKDNFVDTSNLRHVLANVTEKQTTILDANVTMYALLSATLEHSLVPLVVMEFPGITVGGGYSGTAGKSSTFRHGFFESTVNSVEMVLADGSIVTASRDDNSDLFRGAAPSFSTIGVVTMLEIQLRDAAEAVELAYHVVKSIAEAVKFIEQETANGTDDYLDGIVYEKPAIVICSGRLTTVPSGVEVVQLLRPQTRGSTCILPILPFDDAHRIKHDRLLRARVMYHALHAIGLAKETNVQDVGVPYNAAEEFHQWLDRELGIYPLWTCPLRQRRDGGADVASHGRHADPADPTAMPEFLMNFGVWGPGSRDRAEFARVNRRLEAKVHELGGKEWLYAHTYYSEREFWDIYPRDMYDTLRERYGATHLPSVFDKVRMEIEAEERALRASWRARLAWTFWHIWPLRGLYGYYKAARGGDYLGGATSLRSQVIPPCIRGLLRRD